MTEAPMAHADTEDAPPRRDFLFVATGAVGAVAARAAVWPLINSMNPSADVVALSSIEIDLENVEVGARITVSWQKKPLFIEHRTEATIARARARAEDLDDMRGPAPDAERVQRPEWLIVIGIYMHLGCIPLAQGAGDPLGARAAQEG